MTELDIIIGTWKESPLDFFITVAMPFIVLAGLWGGCLLRKVQLPRVFYPLAVICSIASIIYSPVCACVGAEQTIATTVIALSVSAIFFGPVSLGYVLYFWWRTS